MKKILFIALLFATVSASAQVTQAEITALIGQFKPEAMETFYINNERTFYDDGSSKLASLEYAPAEATIEAKATGIYLRVFTDNTKTTLRGIKIIPYKSILNVYFSAKFLKINLVGS